MLENILYIHVAGLEGNISMAFGLYNNPNRYSSYVNFSAASPNAPEVIAKPIEKVENVITNTVDSFVKEPQDEEKKKSHKTAIAAGSTVLVLSTLVALLNPRFSGKFLGKLQNLSHKAAVNVQKNKDDIIKSKFYKTSEKVLKKVFDIFQFTNSANASKDLGFKWLCTAEKFNGVKNDSARKVLKTCDAGFRKLMTPLHEGITKWFDGISKSTVYHKYNSAGKKLDYLDDLIKNYKNKLTPSEQKQLEAKLSEIKNAQKYFSQERTAERLAMQEKSMSHLEKDFKDKLFNGYLKQFKGPRSEGTFKQKMAHNKKIVQDNMSFWAEDMLMPSRNTFEQEGKKAVEELMGDGKNIRGKYNEVIDMLSPHITKEEKGLLDDSLRVAKKKLGKANHSECVEYFDKKRDLMLGGAPSDIISGIGMIGLSGIAVGTADTKEDRVSRALTLGFPAVAGIGASMALTAMLFSGVQSIIYGSIASAGLSQLGSIADRTLNPKKTAENLAQSTSPPKQPPVQTV